MTDPLAALVLDADSRMAVVAIRCLARAGRPVGVVSTIREGRSIGAASRYPVLRAAVPDPSEDEDGYVAAVVALLDRYRPRVLIPAGDRSVAVIRRHRGALSACTQLALAAEPALAMAVDKRLTLELARRIGLAVPCGVLVTAQDDVAKAEAVGLPCVVKPTVSWSAGSARVGRLTCHLAVDRHELHRAVQGIVAAGAAALVQEWLPGQREAVHLLYARGEVRARVCVVARRTAPALGGDSIMRWTVPLQEDVVVAAERLVRAMDLEGYAEVEFRRDAQGRARLMEVNPRLSASVETATRAGVNFPVLLHDWARGAPVQRVEGYRAGVRLRWVGGELRWLRECLRSASRPDVPSSGRAMTTLLLDTFRPAAYDLADPRDPGPAVRKIAKAVTGRRPADSRRHWT